MGPSSCAVFTTKTAPVAPLFLPTMSLSKNEDTAVQTERLSSSDLDAEKAHATEHAERLSELADPDAGKSPSGLSHGCAYSTSCPSSIVATSAMLVWQVWKRTWTWAVMTTTTPRRSSSFRTRLPSRS